MMKNFTNPHAQVRQAKVLALWKFIFLLLLTAQARANDGYAQNTVTLTEKNVPINRVLKKIQRQTGYTYFAPVALLQRAKHISIDVKDVSLTYALDKIFESQPLTYKIVQRVIIVQERGEESVKGVSLNGGGGPNEEIRGKVTTEDGEPIAGANVSVKGTNKVVTTNHLGEYVLNDVAEGAVLEVTYVGYEKKILIARSGAVINTSLAIASKELDVAIVQAYGVTTRRLNTGNISKVSYSDISKQPVANPLAALQGRVPGLIVTQTNGYGNGRFEVQIRGQSSILQGSEPFFIIDGVPLATQNNPLNQINNASQTGVSPFYTINPADIESIEVLKDADATAIYGSRGANGVILITTKKGKSGKTTLNGNIYSGWSKVSRTMAMLDTKQYISMRREAFANDGTIPTVNNAPDLMVWDTTRYTDIKKLLIGGTARIWDGNLAISGGSANTQFLINGGFHRETTVMPIDLADHRVSLHSSIRHTSENKKLQIDLINRYSYTSNNLPNIEATAFINYAPNIKLYDSLGNLNWQEGGIAFRNLGYASTFTNPLAALKTTYEGKFQNLTSNFIVNYKLLPFFSIRLNAGYNAVLADEIRTNPSQSLDPFDNAQTLNAGFANGSDKTWIIEPQVELAKLTRAGKIGVLIGSTFQARNSNSSSVSGTNYTSDLLLRTISGAGTISSVLNGSSKYRYSALFGRLNYNWKDKYILNLTTRRDGSSRFGPGKQFNTFGAVGAGWVFSNEAYFQDKMNWLAFGKIRGSYGTSGNDAIGDYQFLNRWNASANTYQGVPVLTPAALFNAELAWEINYKLEGAIDLSFWDQRLTISMAYFKNRSGNQLISYNLPIQTGFSSINKNQPALVENTGVEIILEGRPIMNTNLTWNTQFNISSTKNKLVEFPGLAASSYANTFVIGEPVSITKRYKSLGIDPGTGFYTFYDLNNSGGLDIGDRIMIKNTMPKYFGGFRNMLSYKSFELDVLFHFTKQEGLNYLNYVGARSMPGVAFKNQPTIVLNRWQKPGQITDIQRFTTSTASAVNQSNNLLGSDAIISDASFIRCKNISISYRLPKRILKQLHSKDIQFYMHAQNIFTITNYEGADPENQNLYSMPPLKTWTLGVNFLF